MIKACLVATAFIWPGAAAAQTFEHRSESPSTVYRAPIELFASPGSIFRKMVPVYTPPDGKMAATQGRSMHLAPSPVPPRPPRLANAGFPVAQRYRAARTPYAWTTELALGLGRDSSAPPPLTTVSKPSKVSRVEMLRHVLIRQFGEATRLGIIPANPAAVLHEAETTRADRDFRHLVLNRFRQIQRKSRKADGPNPANSTMQITGDFTATTSWARVARIPGNLAISWNTSDAARPSESRPVRAGAPPMGVAPDVAQELTVPAGLDGLALELLRPGPRFSGESAFLQEPGLGLAISDLAAKEKTIADRVTGRMPDESNSDSLAISRQVLAQSQQSRRLLSELLQIPENP